MPDSPRLKKAIKAVLVIGFLVAFFFYAPIQDIYRAVLSADLFFFMLAVLLGFPGTLLSTLSTWFLAREQGIRMSVWEFYLFNLAIRFYGYFSPASAIATGLRWYKLSTGNKGAEALSAIAITRMLSILAAISMGLFWMSSGVDQRMINPLVFVLFLVVSVASWLLLTRLSPVLASTLHRQHQKASLAWTKKITGFVGRFFASIEVYSNLAPSVLILIASLNLVNEILGFGSHVLIARALHIPLTITDLGWLRAISFLAALTPFTLAGGIGLREVSLVVILSTFDINPDLATAYSFLIYARGAVFSLSCGLVELISVMRAR